MTTADPGATLRAFLDTLGGGHVSWQMYERTTDFIVPSLAVSRERVLAISAEQFRALGEDYPNSLLVCAFYENEDLLLRVHNNITEQDIQEFARQSQGLDEVTLQLRIDKLALARRVFVEPEGCQLFLYIYEGAFLALLHSTFELIENGLWGASPVGKAVVAISSYNVFLDGRLLAVVGGECIERLPEVAPGDSKEFARVLRCYETCRHQLRWQRPWLNHLTPWHLIVDGEEENGKVGAAVGEQIAKLFVLYTADRSIERDGDYLCTYSQPEFQADVVVPGASSTHFVANLEQLAAIRSVLDWVYEDPTSTARLSIMQVVTSRRLHFMDAGERYARLLELTIGLRQELTWAEKAVMSNSLRSYSVDVRSLEDVVDRTVQSFGDQVSGLTKSLSDTILAGIGTVVVGSVALILKEGTGSIILAAALLGYAGYIALFQIGLGLVSYRDRKKLLVDDFRRRCQLFKERLYSENVAHVVGNRVHAADDLFERWYKRVWCINLILALVMVAIGVGLLSRNVSVTSLHLTLSPTIATPNQELPLRGVPSSTAVPTPTSLHPAASPVVAPR